MLKYMLMVLWIVLMLSNAYGSDLRTVTVIGTGVTKDEALSSALRDAVRQGAGVTVFSKSEVKNFTLECDAIFEKCLGFVESYKTIECGYNQNDECHWVKIEATVSKKVLSTDNEMAMKLLLKRKGSPKLWIEAIKEDFGLQRKMGTISDKILKEIAGDMGITVVNMENFRQMHSRDIARSEVLDDSARVQRRKQIKALPYDCKIEVSAEGEISELIKNVRDVSLSADLQAFWADSSETIASMSMEGIIFKGAFYQNARRNFQMPASLTRAYLKELLNGTNEEANRQLAKNGKEKNAKLFFRKIALKWIAELDIGMTVRLEIEKTDLATIKELVKTLKETDRISGVRLKSFDVRDYSVIEFESRCETVALINILVKKIDKKYQFDQATPRRIIFVKK
jgi:hypothetical protein